MWFLRVSGKRDAKLMREWGDHKIAEIKANLDNNIIPDILLNYQE